MALDLSVIQEVVIDDSKALPAAQRVVAANEAMAASETKVTAARGQSARGLALLDAAVEKSAGTQQSALRALNMWKAAADPHERVIQRLAKAEADLDRARKQGLISQEEQIRVLSQLETRLRSAAVANDNFGRGSATAAGSARGIGTAFQQAGYQVGDFAVQVASGQGVLRPFIQQGTQLISMFGPWGAVIGAAVAVVGALATNLFDVTTASEQAQKATKTYNDAVDRSNQLLMTSKELEKDREQRSLDTVRAKIQEALATETNNVALANEIKLRYQQRQQTIEDLKQAGGLARNAARQLERENTFQGFKPELLDAQIADSEKKIGNLLTLWEKLDNPAQLGSNRETRIKAENEALKEQEKRLELIRKSDAELASQQDKDRLAAMKRGDDIVADDRKRQASLEEYIRGLENQADVVGLTTTEQKVQLAILEQQKQLGRELSDIDRERIRRAIETRDAFDEQRKAAEKMAQQLQRSIQHTTDRLVDFAGDAIFDRLTGKVTKFWDTFKDYGLRMISQLAAEMALRPLATALTADVAGDEPVTMRVAA